MGGRCYRAILCIPTPTATSRTSWGTGGNRFLHAVRLESGLRHPIRDRATQSTDVPVKFSTRRERCRPVPDHCERTEIEGLRSPRDSSCAKANPPCTNCLTQFHADGVARWLWRNLRSGSKALRPNGWTSADAAGLLSSLAGALRRGTRGQINHAQFVSRFAHAARVHSPGDTLRKHAHERRCPTMALGCG